MLKCPTERREHPLCLPDVLSLTLRVTVGQANPSNLKLQIRMTRVTSISLGIVDQLRDGYNDCVVEWGHFPNR